MPGCGAIDGPSYQAFVDAYRLVAHIDAGRTEEPLA